MKSNNEDNWMKNVLSHRYGAKTSIDRDELGDAEYNLAIGRILQGRLRRGLDISDFAFIIDRPVSECEIALAFANSPPVVIFRALMEDWTFERIKLEICPEGCCASTLRS